MTKKSRTILFFSCLFLFIILAPTMVLYSQGYRLNLHPEEGSKFITQTGGLFVSAKPKQADIYINDVLERKTDFFFGSALVENLLPKKYKIRIEGQDFFPWEKTLEIREKEVTEAKNVILFPKDIGLKTMVEDVEKFWPLADDRSFVLMEKNGTSTWSLKIYDSEKNVKSHLINDSDLAQTPVDLIKLVSSKDSKELYLTIGAEEEEKNITLNLSKTPPTITRTKTATTSKNIIASKTENNNDYYLDISGYVFKNKNKLNETPVNIIQETPYEIYVFQDSIFLKENETIYQLDQETKSFEKTLEDIKGLSPSPDGTKLVFFSDYEIWILPLKDVLDRKAGEKFSLIRFSENIKDCLWLNEEYLILNVNNKVKISEINDKDKLNIVDVAEIKNPGQEIAGSNIFWNKNNNKLYILSEGNLYQSEPLIP